METDRPIPEQGWNLGPVVIGAGCWIGMGVCIRPGSRWATAAWGRRERGHTRCRAVFDRPWAIGQGNQEPRGHVRVLFLQRQTVRPCAQVRRRGSAAPGRSSAGLRLSRPLALSEFYGSGDELFDGWGTWATAPSRSTSFRRCSTTSNQT